MFVSYLSIIVEMSLGYEFIDILAKYTWISIDGPEQRVKVLVNQHSKDITRNLEYRLFPLESDTRHTSHPEVYSIL